MEVVKISDKRFDSRPKGKRIGVRSHTRTLQNGRVVNVQEHLRTTRDKLEKEFNTKWEPDWSVDIEGDVDPRGEVIIHAQLFGTDYSPLTEGGGDRFEVLMLKEAEQSFGKAEIIESYYNEKMNSHTVDMTAGMK